jgi:hypothetical protein
MPTVPGLSVNYLRGFLELSDDRYRTCNACMRQVGLEGCLSRPAWQPLPTPLLSPLAGHDRRGEGDGVLLAGVIEANRDRINKIITYLALIEKVHQDAGNSKLKFGGM